MSMPHLLRLPTPWACSRGELARRIAGVAKRRRVSFDRAWNAFAFRCDEQTFASSLLSKHTQWWLFRSHQRMFCGDFVAVDMSAKRPDERRVLALDLKLDGRVRRARGQQLARIEQAMAELRPDVIGKVSEPHCLVGDGTRLLTTLASA